MITQAVIDLARYLAIVAGIAGALVAGGIGRRYARDALEVGVRQMWVDLKMLHLDTLLPVHVALVSFVMAGMLVSNCVELFIRLGEPATWRLLFLPLHLLAVLSIMLVGIFVRNKGPRVVVEGEPRGLRDRVGMRRIDDVAQRQHQRRLDQDDRTRQQDERDVRQDERADESDERGEDQNVREGRQNVREGEQNAREGEQNVRDRGLAEP